MTGRPGAPARGRYSFDDDGVFDLLRGVAALTGNPIVTDLAASIAEAPRPDMSIAFNHKQIGSKLWLREEVAATIGPAQRNFLIVGGWYGVLSALLLNDERFASAKVTSLDIDPSCAPVARALNRRFVDGGRFDALTGDMNTFDYSSGDALAFDCVINTSCEHTPDVRGWLSKVRAGTAMVLQSNDYRREPDHVSCVSNLAEFESQTGLSSIEFRGERPTKNYRRFMLIGRR
ncbi:MAG: class I SAM-dependent methyltransferase [Beijerinckiaceae bacterium]